MAHIHSKGFYIQQLRGKGIKVHPVTKRHLAHTKLPDLRNLYNEIVKSK